MEPSLPTVVIEDQRDDRDLFCRVINREPDFFVIADFPEAEAFLAWLAVLPPAQRPRLLVVDWHLGEGRMDGIELISEIKLLYPEMGCVLITAYDLAHLPGEAARCGADGFIYKSDSPKLLPIRLRAALAGQFPISPKAAQYLFASARQEGAALAATLSKLTQAERAVLLAFIAGRPEKQLADERKRSIHTIRNQLASAYKKLGVHSVTEAAALLRGGGGIR